MSIAPPRGAGGGGIGGNNSCLGMQANYHVPKGKEARASDRSRGKTSTHQEGPGGGELAAITAVWECKPIIMFQKGRRQGLLIGRGEKRQISRDLKDKFAEKSADFEGFINYKVTRKYLMSKHGLVK